VKGKNSRGEAVEIALPGKKESAFGEGNPQTPIFKAIQCFINALL
jgi:hypothetical protein